MLLGACYARQHQLIKGLQLLDSSIVNFNKIIEPSGTIDALYYKHKAYLDNNKYKDALQAFKTYIDLKDSIASKQNKTNIEDLKLKYDTERKDRQLIEQSLTMTEQEHVLSRHRWIIITILLVLAGTVSIVIFLFIYLRQRKNNYQVNLEKLKKEKEVVSLKFLMEGEERERSRIARELHDGVNGGLAAIKLVTGCEIKNQTTENENLLKISSMLDNMSDEVREISHNLMPEGILRSGLPETINSHVDKINKCDGIQLDFQAYGDMNQLDMEVKMAVFRIIQELIKNMLKHANATEGLIQLNKHEKELSLVVEDNGVGFDVFEKAKTYTMGIGLKNIFHRVEVLNGTVDVQSESGSGTTVCIDIPLN